MRRLLTILLITTTILAAERPGRAAADPADSAIVVIAHRSAPDTVLDKDALLDFYTGDITAWSDGTRVVVLDLDDHQDLRDRFFDYLGKTSSRMRSIWLKNMLSGEGRPPDALRSEEEVVRRVLATPGAIGFISKAKVPDNVKVLLTISE